MTKPTADRQQIFLRRHAAIYAAGGIFVAAVAVWAWSPLPAPEVDPPLAPPSRADPASLTVPAKVAVFDRSGFERKLWWLLPTTADSMAADATKESAVQVLSLDVSLIGITEIDGTLIAALYDRRADRLRLVRQGEMIAEAEVAEVSKDKVRLARGDGELVLLRRRPGS